MGFALPVDPRLVNHPHIGLMDQRRGAEPVPHGFVLQKFTGQPTEVFVHQRKQLVGFARLTGAAARDNVGDGVHAIQDNPFGSVTISASATERTEFRDHS